MREDKAVWACIGRQQVCQLEIWSWGVAVRHIPCATQWRERQKIRVRANLGTLYSDAESRCKIARCASMVLHHRSAPLVHRLVGPRRMQRPCSSIACRQGPKGKKQLARPRAPSTVLRHRSSSAAMSLGGSSATFAEQSRASACTPPLEAFDREDLEHKQLCSSAVAQASCAAITGLCTSTRTHSPSACHAPLWAPRGASGAAARCPWAAGAGCPRSPSTPLATRSPTAPPGA